MFSADPSATRGVLCRSSGYKKCSLQIFRLQEVFSAGPPVTRSVLCRSFGHNSAYATKTDILPITPPNLVVIQDVMYFVLDPRIVISKYCSVTLCYLPEGSVTFLLFVPFQSKDLFWGRSTACKLFVCPREESKSDYNHPHDPNNSFIVIFLRHIKSRKKLSEPHYLNTSFPFSSLQLRPLF